MQKLVMLLVAASSLFASAINWSHDYKAALKKAAKENKPVYVLIVSDYCRWCRKFESTTMQDKNVKERLAKEFVVVHLSRERDFVPEYFQVKPIPRHYFVDKDGNILYESLGHRDVATFINFMDEVKKDLEEN